MLAKINKITNWQAALIIAVSGFVVFFTGLTNPFQGDDILQIVNNVPVHSITHFKLFFEGSTFYNGQGIAPLSGTYFRPLMLTIFSLLYTVFGPHSLYFHLSQLLLCIGAAFLLYLVLKYSFSSILSLALSLIFLVHPLNSQNVYAIPNMQDASFLFFGMLAIWLLLKFQSIKGLIPVALCLFLCMLSKETSILFVLMAGLYLLWFNRKRLLPFLGIITPAVAIYLALKINAVGLFTSSNLAPIDRLSFLDRLLTAPSIMLFFLTKALFPWRLASDYYWTYTTFSIRHVLVPLIVDIAVIALVVYLAFVIRRRTSKAMQFTYIYFATWVGAGLLAHLQILTPLDATVTESWFYFSMAGLMGMIGVVLVAFQSYIRPMWFVIIAVLLIGTLGVRTALRGTDWRSQYVLALHDIGASKEDFNAYNDVAAHYLYQNNYAAAKPYLLHSISIQPTETNYGNLGLVLMNLGDYHGAKQALDSGIRQNKEVVGYEELGVLSIVYGNPNANRQFLQNSIEMFPHDSVLWQCLALLEEKYKDNADSKVAITQAVDYGPVPEAVYYGIINDKPFSTEIAGVPINIP